MNNINYDKLIKRINNCTKKSYQAVYVDGKLATNVANFGGKIGDVVKVQRSTGQYSGLAVELLENLRPLLTDNLVVKILTLLQRENYVTPLEILRLVSLDELMYVLARWTNRALDPPILNSAKYFNYQGAYPKYDIWIERTRSEPLLARVKIVEIGFDKKTNQSAVPIQWIDRIFDDGAAVHQAMDKLDTRLGQPPVTYAIIYSMSIVNTLTFVANPQRAKFKHVFYLDLDVDHARLVARLDTTINDTYKFVQYGDIMIGFVLDDILVPKTTSGTLHVKEVGLLVSILQKSVRRGRYGSKILMETIDRLNSSPNYNLPEHGFLRVSACKQLAWRLFITILEDCRPYVDDKLGLLELMLLALITQRLTEYKYTPAILSLIKYLACMAQYHDTHDDLYPWRKLPVSQSTPMTLTSHFHDAIHLALANIIMMPGDTTMLKKYYSHNPKTKLLPFNVPNIINDMGWDNFISKVNYCLHKPQIYRDIELASYDPHCKTYIILYYQACIPISFSTKQISGYIWDISSSYNIRNPNAVIKTDPLLRSIQQYFVAQRANTNMTNMTKTSTIPKFSTKLGSIDNISDHVRRTTFLAIFGSKYRHNKHDVVICGTPDKPLRIKEHDSWIYSDNIASLNAWPKTTIDTSNINPAFGYVWRDAQIVAEIIDGQPVVNKQVIPWFDASSLILPIIMDTVPRTERAIRKIVERIFVGIEVDFDALIKIRNGHQTHLTDWMPRNLTAIDLDLVKSIYTKLFNQIDNIITIGPVTRTGHKMHSSINYKTEGKIWAAFNVFANLYPGTITPNGVLNFRINCNTPGYVHLVQTLRAMLFQHTTITGLHVTIRTKLWDHQRDSVTRIMAGFSRGKFGFGDASDVGSGKTLTSLAIASRLIAQNHDIYSGILVLLPTNNLIATWREEIQKHTQGFDVIFQKNNTDIGAIKKNTIVITTLARARDHPVNHNWLLVVIDECLSVQNSSALWTQNAWCQSVTSKYLIMMSATFFRTRFDKLYYMLKMLRSGLPEQRQYLDAILLESIVSHINIKQRKWISSTHYFTLDKTTKRAYDKIETSSLDTEAKYSRLKSLLYSSDTANAVLVKQLATLIKQLTIDGRKCLIYARATSEAEFWSQQLSIPIYPKRGKHCIVTYHAGTYGVNDLVEYNTIVMRPPDPDKLPQIKGRLDRPGQIADTLYIEYFLFEHTIDMGLLLRMNIAANFFQTYIMPLAEFYDISVNYKKYLTHKKE